MASHYTVGMLILGLMMGGGALLPGVARHKCMRVPLFDVYRGPEGELTCISPNNSAPPPPRELVGSALVDWRNGPVGMYAPTARVFTAMLLWTPASGECDFEQPVDPAIRKAVADQLVREGYDDGLGHIRQFCSGNVNESQVLPMGYVANASVALLWLGSFAGVGRVLDACESKRLAALARGKTHCRNCGYDLRGISVRRCPECGYCRVWSHSSPTTAGSVVSEYRAGTPDTTVP